MAIQAHYSVNSIQKRMLRLPLRPVIPPLIRSATANSIVYTATLNQLTCTPARAMSNMEIINTKKSVQRKCMLLVHNWKSVQLNH